MNIPTEPEIMYRVVLRGCAMLLQMPKGVPVATVAIGNAANAGLLGLRILAASDSSLQQKMLDYQVHTCASQIYRICTWAFCIARLNALCVRFAAQGVDNIHSRQLV